MRSHFPNREPSYQTKIRLSWIAAALLTGSVLGLYSGCATAGNERTAETPTEERLRLLYPERDSQAPTVGEMRAMERENHERDNPHFPALRSLPLALSGASRQKQSPCSYDRESHIGKLDKGLDEGPKRGWSIVSMKDDWNRIDPESNPRGTPGFLPDRHLHAMVSQAPE